MNIIKNWRIARQQLASEGFKENWLHTIVLSGFFIAFITCSILATTSTISFMGFEIVQPFEPLHFVVAPILFVLLALSITFYQHRVLAHMSAKAHRVVHLFFIALQTMTFQGSAASWGGQHIVHHGKGDTGVDPYSVHKFPHSAFWSYMWAHHWNFFFDSPHKALYDKAANSLRSKFPILVWQEKYYVLLAVGLNLLCALLVAWLCSPEVTWASYGVAVLMQAGVIGAVHQVTWMVNSCTHTRADKHMFKSKRWSSVDRPIVFIFSMLPLGEGNQHRGHHDKPTDFFNGAISRWVYDPTGWLGLLLEFLGLAELKRGKRSVLLKYHYEQRMECVLCKIPAELHGKLMETYQARKQDVQAALDEAIKSRDAYVQEKTDALKEACSKAERDLKVQMDTLELWLKESLKRFKAV